MSLSDLRLEYTLAGLQEADLDRDPFKQFDRWFQEALEAQLPEPNAMTLATATVEGVPSARIVLLKDFDTGGFVFFTSYQSQKAQELEQNPRAALVFFWAGLERQVRITGFTSRVSQQESEEYFLTRPRGSQLGAWASKQSEVVASRQVLEQRMGELEIQYQGSSIPVPPFWGGFRLAPQSIEFWQGRPNRLHDRLQYTLQPDRTWLIERLSP